MPYDVKALAKSPRSKKIVVGVVVVGGGYLAYRWWANRSAGDAVPVTGDVGVPVDASGVVGAPASGNVQYAGSTTDTRGEPKPGNFANDAEWTQYAAEKLSTGGTRSVDAVYSALGDYLAERPLDETESSIVTSAWAVAGDPPSGHKPIIKQIGEVSLTAPTGLKAANVTRTTVDLSWAPVPGAAFYFVWNSTSGANIGGTSQTSKTVGSLKPGTAYKFAVGGATANGKNGPRSGYISVTTKK